MVTLLYAGSTLFHIIALYYGLMCVKHGEALFTRSSPRDILTSRIEQKYWTVILRILSNLLLLAVMPMYMLKSALRRHHLAQLPLRRLPHPRRLHHRPLALVYPARDQVREARQI